MTTFQARNKAHRAASWRYDSGEVQFINGDKRFDHRKILKLAPGMNLNQPASYQDNKFARRGMGRK